MYKKITKPSHKNSHSKPKIRITRPNKPPPPKIRPITISKKSINKKKSNIQNKLPHKPFSLSSLNVYEKINNNNFNINNIKH